MNNTPSEGGISNLLSLLSHLEYTFPWQGELRGGGRRGRRYWKLELDAWAGLAGRGRRCVPIGNNTLDSDKGCHPLRNNVPVFRLSDR